MPIVRLWSLPDVPKPVLEQIREAIRVAVLGIPELGLHRKEDVSVLAPSDQMNDGLAREILVEVVDLFEKPERTYEVRMRLAEALGNAVRTFFLKAKIECAIRPFDPRLGYWSSVAAIGAEAKPNIEPRGPMVTLRPGINWDLFLENRGLKLVEHDEREMTLECVHLSDIVFQSYVKCISVLRRIDEILERVRSQQVIRLGPRFMLNLYSDEVALSWLADHDITRIVFLGARFQMKQNDKISFFPYLYRACRLGQCAWHWKFSSASRGNFHCAELPVK